MSTFTEGPVPSVKPGQDDEPPAGSAAPPPPQPGGGSDWLRAEIQRRMETGSRSGRRGRHARRDDAEPVARDAGTAPRHSAPTGPPAPAPAVADGPPPGPPPAIRHEPTPPAGGDRSARPEQPPVTRRAAPAVTGPMAQAPSPLLGGPSLPGGAAAARTAPADRTVPTRTAPRTKPVRAAPAPLRAGPYGVPPWIPPPQRHAPEAGPPSGAVPVLPTGPTPVPPGPGAEPDALADPSSTDPRSARAPRDEAGDTVLWSAGPPTVPPPSRPVGGDRSRAPVSGASADAPTPEEEQELKRVRVVLAERKNISRPVRTVVDVQEGTGVGELLRSNLIGSQLAVALRFAVGAGVALGVLPLLFALIPQLGEVEVLGVRLPWLLLGLLVYPFLYGLGLWHTRTAERVEQNFADHVQDN